MKLQERLPGLDGNAKMSKSLGNGIFLSDDEDTVRKKSHEHVHRPGSHQDHRPGQDRGKYRIYLSRCILPAGALRALSAGLRKSRRVESTLPERRLGDVKVKKFLNNVLQETLEPIRNRRKELEKIKKNIPTKAEDFLDGFGETVVLSAGASKGPATLVSREPGELATIYLGKRYHSDRKTGNCGGCSDQYTNCQQDSC